MWFDSCEEVQPLKKSEPPESPKLPLNLLPEKPIAKNLWLVVVKSSSAQDVFRNWLPENVCQDSGFANDGFDLMVARQATNDLLYYPKHALVRCRVNFQALLTRNCDSLRPFKQFQYSPATIPFIKAGNHFRLP